MSWVRYFDALVSATFLEEGSIYPLNMKLHPTKINYLYNRTMALIWGLKIWKVPCCLWDKSVKKFRRGVHKVKKQIPMIILLDNPPLSLLIWGDKKYASQENNLITLTKVDENIWYDWYKLCHIFWQHWTLWTAPYHPKLQVLQVSCVEPSVLIWVRVHKVQHTKSGRNCSSLNGWADFHENPCRRL